MLLGGYFNMNNDLIKEIKQTLSNKYDIKNIRMRIHKDRSGISKSYTIDIYKTEDTNEDEIKNIVLPILKQWGFRENWDMLSVFFWKDEWQNPYRDPNSKIMKIMRMRC
jgi:hypothetical protein